jgi:hypothetical protein
MTTFSRDFVLTGLKNHTLSRKDIIENASEDIVPDLQPNRQLFMDSHIVTKGRQHLLQHMQMLSDDHFSKICKISECISTRPEMNLEDENLGTNLSQLLIEYNPTIKVNRFLKRQNWMLTNTQIEILFDIDPQPSQLQPIKMTEACARHGRTSAHGFIQLSDLYNNNDFDKDKYITLSINEKIVKLSSTNRAYISYWLSNDKIEMNGLTYYDDRIGTTYASDKPPGSQDYELMFLHRIENDETRKTFIESDGGNYSLIKSLDFYTIMRKLKLITRSAAHHGLFDSVYQRTTNF